MTKLIDRTAETWPNYRGPANAVDIQNENPTEKPTEQWQRVFEKKDRHTLVDAERVYGVLYGEVVALDRETGKTMWRHTCSCRGGGTAALSEKSVLINDINKNLLTSDTVKLISLDKQTGEQRWERAFDVRSGGVGLWPVVHEGVVYCDIAYGDPCAIDIETGETIWQVELNGQFGGNRPIVTDSSCYFLAGGDERTGLYAIRKKSGEKSWEQVSNKYGGFDMIASNSYVWFIAEEKAARSRTLIHCYKDTGEKVWQTRMSQELFPSLTKSEDTLYIPQRTGLTALDAGSGSRRWICKNVPSGTSVVTGQTSTVNGLVYMLAQKELVTVCGETGKIKWRYRPGDGYYLGRPSVADGTVYTVLQGDKYILKALS
jgi:hypothetical protein